MASDHQETRPLRIAIRRELGLEKPAVFEASASRSLSWAIYCQRSKADFTCRMAAVHASVSNHFNSERHIYSRQYFKPNSAAALAEWRLLCSA